MVNYELQEKFFCPRLIDYIVVVGSYSPLSKHSAASSSSADSASRSKHTNVPQQQQQQQPPPKEEPSGGGAGGSSSLNRSSSVASSKARQNRSSRNSKKTPLYSVGRALTCSSFGAANSSISHIQVRKLITEVFFFSFLRALRGYNLSFVPTILTVFK